MFRSDHLKSVQRLFVIGLAIASVAYACPILAEPNDPTRPLSYAAPSEDKGQFTISRRALVVESILISSRRRIVVINGRSLGEGDYFDGMQITVIGEDSVGIRSEGEVFFLKPEITTTLMKRQS